MLGKGAGQLARGGKMDEAIALVVGAAAIDALTLGLTPSRSGANFINRGHRSVGFRLAVGFSGFSGAARTAADRIGALRRLQGWCGVSDVRIRIGHRSII